MKFARLPVTLLCAAMLCGCVSHPTVPSSDPETLFVQENGTMLFRDRVMADDDVIIYADGNGGERAAIRIRAEPLHPDYFRDSIVVERH